METKDISHPLMNDPRWVYWQPYIKAKATILVVDKKDNISIKSVITEATCREAIITNMQARLRDIVIQEVPVKGRPSYYKKKQRTKRIRLYDTRLLVDLPKANQLTISINALKEDPVKHGPPSNDKIKEYIEVADALVGIPSVLLSHRRPKGYWWRSEPIEVTDGYVSWNGSDNWFMRHPVLLAIATGLLRQAALLVAKGYGRQILKCVDRKQIEEVLTTADWKLAYKLALKLRPWIEVPAGINGNHINYPFSMGFWHRFDYLQRAQRKHNYKKIFGNNFYESWALMNGNLPFLGVYSFWGDNPHISENVDNYRRLVELGKPRRRAGRGKNAAQTS